MEQVLPSFHNKPSVTITGVFLWEFHHSGTVQCPLSNSPSLQHWTCTRCCPPRLVNKQHINTQLQGPDTNRHQSSTQTLSEPLSTSTRCLTFYPWHRISLINLLLGPVIPCLPDFPKIKWNQHLSNLSQAWTNHSQAAAVTGPKSFLTDLLHILFNNHHLRHVFSQYSQAHFADRQKVNLRLVFCESLAPAIRMNTIM